MDQFLSWARRAPERVGLIDGAGPMSYGELVDAVDQLAARLSRHGVAPGAVVAVSMERSRRLVIAVLAVLRCGAAYLPLDPALPQERRRLMVEDSQCHLILSCGSDGQATVQLVEVHPVEIAGSPSLTRFTDLAYVIYTSGSTGGPKGVLVSTDNVDRLFLGLASVVDYRSDDIWTMFHSYSFDFSVWELWGALAHGGCLVVVAAEVARDPDTFFSLLLRQQVTVLSQTPSAFYNLSNAAMRAGAPATALRLVVLGGERLNPMKLAPWVAAYGSHPRLINMYGITETTVHTTYHEITPSDLASSESPIGVPLPDLAVELVDEELRPVPDGETGEIVVWGPGVAHGYLGRDELTRTHFLVAPDGRRRGYRSGDLAFRGPNGCLSYVGRRDDQVKIRGFRIEPGEVDAAACRTPYVTASATVVVRSANGASLVTSVVGAPDAPSGLASLVRASLTEQLPGHMVPSAVRVLDSLPLTHNGKVDRRALEELGLGTNLSQDSDAPPDSDHPESEVLHIIRQVLCRSDATESDNFFALGGDSMSAVLVTAQLRDAGFEVRASDLFAAPTLGDLRELGSGRAAGSPEPVAVPRPVAPEFPRDLPPGVESALPASALQAGMLYHAELTGDPTLNHDLVSVQLRGLIEPAVLDRVLVALVASHETLRTVFEMGDAGGEWALVLSAVDIHIQQVDWAGDVRSWWQEQWRRGFDLERGPLLRCHLLRHDRARATLALSAHHSILDGWSFSVLLTELLCGYDALLAGMPWQPAKDGHGSEEFVYLEREEARSEAAAQHWRQLLAHAQPVPLPLPKDQSAGAISVFPDHLVELPEHQVDEVQSRAARWLMPSKSLWQGLYLGALADATGAEDVVSCVVVNGRPERPDTDSFLGLFLNSLPVRQQWGHKPDLREVASSLLAQEQQMHAYLRYPISSIVRAERHIPLITLFNYTSFAPTDRLASLRHLRVADWWSCDRSTFPVTAELSRRPMNSTWEWSVRVDKAHCDSSFGATLTDAFLERLAVFVGRRA